MATIIFVKYPDEANRLDSFELPVTLEMALHSANSVWGIKMHVFI